MSTTIPYNSTWAGFSSIKKNNEYYGLNLVKPSSGRDRYDISISNIKDITTKVIPFFDNSPLYGAKYLDYKDFCKGGVAPQL